MLYGELPEVELDGTKVRGITVKVPNPPKSAVVGLPSNEKMIARLDKQRSVRRNLGRRRSETDFIPNQKADLELFEQIRLDRGTAFDEFEASNIISKITYCEVMDCQREGDGYAITLRTLFGDSIHHVNIPLQRDIQMYRRRVVSSVDLPHGQEELRYRIEPAITLYDQVIASVEGYAPSYNKTDVPPHHKSAVVVELVQAVEELDPAMDPNS